MKRALVLCGVFLLVVGFSSMVTAFDPLIRVFETCNVQEESIEPISLCVRPIMSEIKLRATPKIPDAARLEIIECFDGLDAVTKDCLKENVENLFTPKMYDLEAIRRTIESMYTDCGITMEKTPELKLCIDKIDQIVLTEIKPWIPMTDEKRQQLKELGKDYMLCFKAENEEEKNCLMKKIEVFKKKKSSIAISQAGIKKLYDRFRPCGVNECFRNQLVSMFNFNSQSESDGGKKMRLILVKTLQCFPNISQEEREKKFSCIAEKIMGRDQDIGGGSSRKKREVDDNSKNDEDISGKPIWAVFEEGVTTDNQRNSMFRLLFNDKSMTNIQGLINLMNIFISTCADWAPPPEDMRNSELFNKPDPAPKLDSNFLVCKNMYDDINLFIDTGNGYQKYLKETEKEDHEKRRVSTAVIIAACVGGVIGSILIHLLITVACMIRHRSAKNAPSKETTLPTAPQASVPSVYSTFPPKELSIAGLPPTYIETVDEKKVNQSVAAYSQILHSSTKEGAEKSC